MTADDVPACVAVLREHDATKDADEWVALFGRDIDGADRYPVVAVAGSEIVAYARTNTMYAEPDWPANTAPNGYYLSGLIVRPPYRRQGIARLLTTERLRWLQGRADAVHYYTHRTNIASQRLHEELGFVLLTDDFWFPGMGDDHGQLLYRLPLVAE